MSNNNFEIINSFGEKLHAKLELPANQKASQYAIFAHCFTCSSDLSAVRNISRELTNFGFGVLRFDFTGLGKSEGAFEETSFSHNIEDLETVNQFLKNNYEAPTLLIGHSLGGAAVLKASKKIKNIKAVVTIGAPAETKHVTNLFKNGLDEIKKEGKAKVNIGGRPFTISRNFIEDLDSHNIKETLRNLRKPLLILHSPQDKIVSIDNAAKIYQFAYHPKSFISLDGADHLLSNQKDSIYAAKTIATWSHRYLEIEKTNQNRELSLENSQIIAHLNKENKFTTKISNGNHTITADEPKNVGGNDFGFSPYELINAALGACTAMTIKMYADRKKWNLTDVYVYLSHSKEHNKDMNKCIEKDAKIDVIHKKIEFEGNLSENQIERMVEIAEKCPVNKTLKQGIKFIKPT